jgi:hypothetical protein
VHAPRMKKQKHGWTNDPKSNDHTHENVLCQFDGRQFEVRRWPIWQVHKGNGIYAASNLAHKEEKA